MKVKVINAQTLDKVNEIKLDRITSVNNEYIVGRSLKSSLILDSSDVSRMHGKFFLQNGSYYYSDLGSINGTLVNDKLAEQNQIYLLKPGDVIRIGEFLLVMEEIIEEPEVLPLTVFNPDWRAAIKVDTPEVVNQAPEPVSEVPQLVTSESQQLIPPPEEISQGRDLNIIQAPEAALQPSAQTPEAVSETSGKLAAPEVKSQVPSDVSESDLTIIQGEQTFIQGEETFIQAPEAASQPIAQTPEAVSEAAHEVKPPEIDTQVPSAVSESNVTPATAANFEAIALVPEQATIQASEELEAVREQSEVQRSEVLINTENLAVSTPPEPVTQTPEQAVVFEGTIIQAPREASQTSAQTPEAVSEAAHEVKSPEIDTQVPSAVRESDVTPATAANFEAIALVSEQATIQAPEELEEVHEQSEVQIIEIPIDIAHPAVSTVPETVTQTPEQAGVVEETISQAPEEALGTSAQTPEAVSEAAHEVKPPEIDTEVPSAVSESDVTPATAANFEAIALVPEQAIIQAPEELEEVHEQSEVQRIEVPIDTAHPAVSTPPEPVTQTPEQAALPLDIIQGSEEAEVSEVMAQTPETTNKAFEIISKKYIALMAHDSKKSDLVEFVAQHKDFLSKCLTIATPSISETLSQQTGLATSQKTPLVPVGGYQAVASLIGTGDVLAVILLRDFMVPQSSQANEEALLRLCNVNQVLVATNTPTAQAVMHYIRDMVTSL